MGSLPILARVCPALATLALVASLGCGGDDAASSTSSGSADGSVDVSMTPDGAMAVTDTISPDAATEEASPEDSARADAAEPDDFDGSGDSSPTCSVAFLAHAPTADCIGKMDVSTSALQSITTCSAACGGGMGCPLLLDWHNATTTSSSFIVQVDLKATVDVAVTGAVDQSCSLTYAAKNVRCIATFATSPDASETGPHLARPKRAVQTPQT